MRAVYILVLCCQIVHHRCIFVVGVFYQVFVFICSKIHTYIYHRSLLPLKEIPALQEVTASGLSYVVLSSTSTWIFN